MATLLRLYSYLYHAILCLFLLGLSIVATVSDQHTLRLEMLPWTGEELTRWILWGSIAGLIALMLAITRTFKYLFPFWTLLVAIMMVRGFLLTPYSFHGKEQFYWILALIAGAIVAFLGSLTLFKAGKRR